MLALPERSITSLDVIHHCDALSLLRALPSGFVDCIVTSPPYYALRDYGVDGQIGLEATPQLFIERLMQLFREVHRVLKPTGTVWVNLGDSYSGSANSGGTNQNDGGLPHRIIGLPNKGKGLPPKSLMMIPARFAIAMQDEGWILRSDIIWSKKAPMPESVTDRPTKSHEHIYLFAKEPHYFYDQEAVREPAASLGTEKRMDRIAYGGKSNPPERMFSGNASYFGYSPEGRNMRDVWHLSPEASTADHFAAYPTEIPRRCILAGCPEKVCCECGAPYERQVEKSGGTTGKSWHDHANDLAAGMHQIGASQGSAKNNNGQSYTRIDRGLHATCQCNAGTRPGIVLDMFMGTGTSAVIARNLGRHYIGCDLNAEYVAMSRKRLAQSDPYQDRQVTPELKQRSMFAMSGIVPTAVIE